MQKRASRNYKLKDSDKIGQFNATDVKINNKSFDNNIYMEEMNPDLPAESVTSPICCSMLPDSMNTPQIRPPIRALRRLKLIWAMEAFSRERYPLDLRLTASTGSKTRPAIIWRIELNDIGGRISFPSLCATKPDPHTNAVRSRAVLPFARSDIYSSDTPFSSAAAGFSSVLRFS